MSAVVKAMMVYGFTRKNQQMIRLICSVENKASRRIAEKQVTSTCCACLANACQQKRTEI
jgi:hypothetical protein